MHNSPCLLKKFWISFKSSLLYFSWIKSTGQCVEIRGTIHSVWLHDATCCIQMQFLTSFLNAFPQTYVGTGPPSRDRRSLGTKPTHVKPSANRGWPLKPVNHIQPQLRRICPKSSRTPTWQNADGAPPFWRFQRFTSWQLSISCAKHYEKHENKSS